jgi:hypothetical protein
MQGGTVRSVTWSALALAGTLSLTACTGTSRHEAAAPSWRTTFQAQADRVCTAAQARVAAAQKAARIPLYPSSFPAPAFAAYLRLTHGIGAEALSDVKRLPVPADGVAERDAGLKPLEQQVRMAAAAAAAAAQPDGSEYAQLAGGSVEEAPATLVPRSCLGLSLGPSAH